MKLKYLIIVLIVGLVYNGQLFAQETAKVERDYILSLSAMSYVYKDWQEKESDDVRGYNIGALLFDAVKNEVIGWNLNSIYKDTVGKTAHAEVGLMQGNIKKRGNLKGCHIVTTLEPCMMCSGMMVFLEVDSVKYIQTDPEYGNNIERLAADYAGQPANERSMHIKSVRAISGNYGAIFENLYQAFRTNPDNKDVSMAKFLYTKSVRDIYKAAATELKNMRDVKFSQNRALLSQVKSFLF